MNFVATINCSSWYLSSVFYKYNVNLLYVSHMYECIRNPQHTWWGQRTTCRMEFSPSMSILQAEAYHWPIRGFLNTIINALSSMSHLVLTLMNNMLVPIFRKETESSQIIHWVSTGSRWLIQTRLHGVTLSKNYLAECERSHCVKDHKDWHSILLLGMLGPSPSLNLLEGWEWSLKSRKRTKRRETSSKQIPFLRKMYPV